MLGSSAKFHEVFSRFLRLEQNRTHLFMSQKTVAIICLIRPTAPEGHCCTQLAVLWSFKESQYKNASNLFLILILCSYSHGIILIRHGVDKQPARKITFENANGDRRPPERNGKFSWQWKENGILASCPKHSWCGRSDVLGRLPGGSHPLHKN